MIDVILSIINEGLPIINKLLPDQATVIKNKVLNFREKWDEEYAKGASRDDALLDMYTRELFDIGNLFSAALKSTALANSSGS